MVQSKDGRQSPDTRTGATCQSVHIPGARAQHWAAFALCLLGASACGGGGGSDKDAGRDSAANAIEDDEFGDVDAGDARVAGDGGSAGKQEAGVTNDGGDAGTKQDGGSGSGPDAAMPTAGTVTAAGGTVTLMAADGVVSTTLKVPANAVNEDTMVTIAPASLSPTAPSSIEQITPGFSIDLNGKTFSSAAKARLRLPFAPATGELIVLAVTDIDTQQLKYMLETVAGVTYATFDVKSGGRYLAVRLVPADGCTRTLAMSPVITKQSDLDALSDVKRIAASLQIRGSAITSLAGLKCLQQVDGDLQIQGTNAESFAGLERLAFAGVDPNKFTYYSQPGLLVDSNPRLSQGDLPSLYAVGAGSTNSAVAQVQVKGHPLLTSFRLGVLESGGFAFTDNGAASTAVVLSMPALTRAAQLTVQGNPSLQNLDGLPALQVIVGALTISENIGLKNLDGIKPTKVGDVQIQTNAALTSAAGLGNLVQVRSLLIASNPLLRSIDMAELKEILPSSTRDSMQIKNNDGLTRFAADKLTSMGSLFFTSNGNATESTTLSLSGLTQVAGAFNLSQNVGLQSLTGLGALKSTGALTLNQNAALTSTSGLSALESASDVSITNNGKLTDIVGLDNLARIDQGLTISQNAALHNVSLPKLATLGQELDISNNASLQAFSAPALRVVPQVLTFSTNGKADAGCTLSLPALSAVTQNVTIQSNPCLGALDGLAALTSVGGSVSVNNNSTLAQLNGLSALSTITGGLTIQSNPLLTNLNGLSNLSRVSTATNIASNAALTDITLPKLATSGGAFAVSSNAALANVRADALASVSGGLTISQNGTATAVTKTALSFAALTTVQGFSVSGNPKLDTLQVGFPKLSGATSYYVSSNVLLHTCDAVALRNQIQTNGSLSGSSTISSNLSDGCMP